ncbi:MAG: 4-hydroxy-tetrahydrodipicolinate synthase [Cyclobacteriaceae bacterium]
MKHLLQGTGVALVTPFDSGGNIDYRALKTILDHTVKGGADYFVVMGTTGEPATLSPKEKHEVLDFVKKNNPASIPIVYGIGGNSTRGVLEEISNTNMDGVAAILSVSPYYNKPSQAGIQNHYEALADDSPVPILLYNVPGRTASNISATTTLALARHPNIIGIKEAAGDFFQTMTIASEKPADFILISGDDLLMLPLLSIGGEGVISVLANAYPGIFSSILKFFGAGDHQGAAEMAFRLLNLHTLMYEEGSPSGIKFVLSELDLCEPNVRLPMSQISGALKERQQSFCAIFRSPLEIMGNRQSSWSGIKSSQ